MPGMLNSKRACALRCSPARLRAASPPSLSSSSSGGGMKRPTDSADLRERDKLVATVERYQHRAPFAVHRPVLPGRRMRNDPIEFRAAQVHREHASAHEVAHDAAFADESVPECLACRAAATVGADGI